MNALVLLFVSPAMAMAATPFSGSIFIDPDIILEDDPTTYVRIEAAGQGVR